MIPGERITLSGVGDSTAWMANINAYLATPTVQALQPGGGPRPSANMNVDWIFLAKSLGIAAAVAAGFMLLTKV